MEISMRGKNKIHFFRNLLICTAGMILAGFGLLVLVYLLPVGRMKSHVAESDELFNYEGIYPEVMNGMTASRLDNYTDALMYATAIFPGSESPVKEALYNRRYEDEGSNIVQSLNDYAHDVEGKEQLRHADTYGRYWHGYLVVLKPLLLFLNVSEIRMFGMIVQTVLLLMLLYLIEKKLGAAYACPVVLAVLILNPVALPLSLQFSWVYYIGLLGALAVLLIGRPVEDNLYLLLFWALGMLTSYFDLLTYPLFTFGLPVTLFLVKGKDMAASAKVKKLAAAAALWLGGYAAMWAGKWALAITVGGQDGLYRDIVDRIVMRTSAASEDMQERYTWSMAVGRPLAVLGNKVYLVLFLVFLAGCAIAAHRAQKMGRGTAGPKNRAASLLPYALLAVLPFLWFCALCNHTVTHFFTYRELSVTVLAVGTAAVEAVQARKAG